MVERGSVLAVIGVLALANLALASGGTVRPATAGNLDYITVLQVPGGANDRIITRWGREGVAFPNGTEFDPNSVICGARTYSGHQSTVSAARPERLDVRLEDPNNPGFPSVVSLPAPMGSLTSTSPSFVTALAADSNVSPAPCPQSVGYQNYSFNGGVGVHDPEVAIFLTWQTPAATSNAPCYIGLELGSAPNNGRTKFFDSLTSTYLNTSTFGGGNVWLDAVVFTPHILDLNLRVGGSPRFPGDRGSPVWAIRGEEGDSAGSSTIVDDFITATITVNNGTPAPLTNQTLSLVADRSVINSTLAPKDLVAAFRLVGNPTASLASGNPYSWMPGRTILRANIPATINGRLQSLFPKNLPCVAASRNVALPTGTGPRDAKRRELGLRRQRGQVDDGTVEFGQIVQSPAMTGDVLSERWPWDRVFPSRSGPMGPKVDQLSVSAIQLAAASAGGATGFDAVQLRREDPVVLNSADPSPQGLIVAAGTSGTAIGDGVRVQPPIPPDPNFHYAFFEYPASATVRSADGGFFTNVYMFPNDFIGPAPYGTFLALDKTPETITGCLFSSRAGALPYVPDPTANAIVRVIFTASNPLNEPATRAVPAVVTKHPSRIGCTDAVPRHVVFSR
ncbi:MAG: hypothetical protein HYR85_18475 [Planctomycetes bacterium]|nr:hypothetical protein [Planctomycetota bacterium]MBI3843368.1 hypothetical protein [Planctomycetota bacterium]